MMREHGCEHDVDVDSRASGKPFAHHRVREHDRAQMLVP